MQYNVIISKDGEPVSVSAFANGRLLTAGPDHPCFRQITNAIDNYQDGADNEDEIIALFDVTTAVLDALEPLSDQISYRDGVLYFDAEPITGKLADTVAKLFREGDAAYAPLVAFLGKLMTNPEPHSREQLYGWLTANGFQITDDGDIIAYKGVNKGDGTRGRQYLSVNGGHAFSNGTEVHGRIPTSPGAIVEMPRSEVQHDPSVGCHTGLHAGSYHYAVSFAPIVLRVKINPRDVVSVPYEQNQAKMRVCRYKVLGEVTSDPAPVIFQADEDETSDLTLADDEALAEGMPRYYELFTKRQFRSRPKNELMWLAEQWGVGYSEYSTTKKELAENLRHCAYTRLSRKAGA